MNILLVTPPEPYFTPFSTHEKRIPLGVAFLAEVLVRAGHDVAVADCYLDRDAFRRLRFLEGRRFDVVGIHANTICLDGVIRLATQLQRLRERGAWAGRIALGGPLASTHLATVPGWVDHVVVGEGERAILGIAGGSAPRIVEEPRLESLDDLPLPGFERFVHLPYDWSTPWLPGRRTITLNTSRGCPHGCTFCSVRSVWGRKVRAMSAGRVVDWIEKSRTLGFDAIYFREDHFTIDRSRTHAFCEEMLRRCSGVEWICETRVDSLDEEAVALMARAGCRAVYVGVEAGTDAALERLRKNETTEQFLSAFGWFRRHGIRTYASFMVGLPGSTDADDLDSERFAGRLGADHSGFQVFTGIPTSPLYDEALEKGLVRYEDYRGLRFLDGHNRRLVRHAGALALRRMGLHPASWLDSEVKKRAGWSLGARRGLDPLIEAFHSARGAIRRSGLVG